VRGIHQHLEQNFYEAIRYWKKCLEQGDIDRVALDANYWIGYENNNMGRFADAIEALDRARALADGDRAVELTRLTFETRFFELGTHPIAQDFLEVLPAA